MNRSFQTASQSSRAKRSPSTRPSDQAPCLSEHREAVAEGRITQAKALCSKTPGYAHTTQLKGSPFLSLPDRK